MSMLLPFIKSWLLGLAIAAPVGPIGVLCIRHSLDSGMKFGLAVGLGAALADSLYGFLVGGGMTMISAFILTYALYIKLAGGALLLYLAISELRAKKDIRQETVTIKNTNLLPLICTTLLLTLTNPMTIMSFIGIFSTTLGSAFSTREMLLIVFGIFLGSMSWWIFLSKTVSFSRELISVKMLGMIKYFSALILIAFVCYAMISGLL